MGGRREGLWDESETAFNLSLFFCFFLVRMQMDGVWNWASISLVFSSKMEERGKDRKGGVVWLGPKKEGEGIDARLYEGRQGSMILGNRFSIQDRYTSYLIEASPQLLGLSGGPGIEKTMMSSFLVEEVAQLTEGS